MKQKTKNKEENKDSSLVVPMDKIKFNPDNARKYCDAIKLQELADDIKKNGLTHKILIRTIEQGYYEVVSGERRFRAFQLLRRNNLEIGKELEVRELTKEKAQEISFSENIQREDLNCIELANELQRQLKNKTQQQLSKEIGKSQTYISQNLELLELPGGIQQYLSCGLTSKEIAKELLRYKKFLDVMDLENYELTCLLEMMNEYISDNELNAIESRKIIDKKIYFLIDDFYCTEKGEVTEVLLSNGKVHKLKKTEERKEFTDESIDLSRWKMIKRIEWCEHQWTTHRKEDGCDSETGRFDEELLDEEFDYENDDYEYCEHCNVPKKTIINGGTKELYKSQSNGLI